MICPNCGRETSGDQRLCTHCSAELSFACPSCHAPTRVGPRFCDSCGALLDGSETLTAAVPPVPRAGALPTSFQESRYAVKGKLGEGAKKTAFLAHDITLDREVAFALIKGETTDEDTRKRIKREAQTMAGLGDHPNIVPTYDFGDEGGQPFMVMPVMGGGSLEDLMKTTEGGGMELGSLLRIAIDVCRGLEFIHSKSVIHRDLKPGNVWLTDDGVAKIGDFGISVSQAYSRMTLEGTTLGTVLYMAPEQATAGDVDHRVDIYSLGAMLYEMATGQPPFSGVHPVAVISQHLNETPLSPMSRDPSCPPLLDTLIMLLLAKDPGDRPGSAGDVLAALAQIQEAGSDRTSEAEREEPALRVLLVEDSDDDALLVLHELRRGGYGLVSRRVETPADMKAEIEGSTWDLVLCDYSMPRFSGPTANPMRASPTAPLW